MKRNALLGMCLVASAAWADGRYGTHSTPYNLTTEAQRVGAGPLADMPSARFGLWTFGQPTAILFYVGTVHAPGAVALDVELPDGGAQFASDVVVVEGWNEWALPAGFPGQNQFFRLVPDAGVEFSLMHLAGGYSYTNPQTGVSPDIYSLPVYRTESDQHGHEHTSAVVRFAQEPDPLDVLAACPTGNRDAVRGMPYVRVRKVLIGSGQTQLLVQRNVTGPIRLIDARLNYDGNGVAPGMSARPMLLDGGPGASESISGDTAWFQVDKSDAFPAGDGGVSNPFGFQLADDGGLSWYVYDVGDDALDPCHPAVRATYGGNVGRAVNQPPGADFSMRYLFTHLAFRYPDLDMDGFKAGDAGRWDTWQSGLSLGADAGDDCNDSNASIRPGAPEYCDGVDSDCNGVPDDLDRIALIPVCERQLGVCTGARRLAIDCSDGGWAPCPAARYGAAYSSVERCDGVDENCNGAVDENPAGAPLCTEQRGVCAGTHASLCSAATWAACSNADFGNDHEPEETRCDGLDNDCDGLVDGDEATLKTIAACPLQLGVCAGASHVASLCAPADAGCGASDYGPQYQADETSCDGLDNDCDGTRDEGCVAPPPAPRTGCSTAPGFALGAVLLVLGARRMRVATLLVGLTPTVARADTVEERTLVAAMKQVNGTGGAGRVAHDGTSWVVNAEWQSIVRLASTAEQQFAGPIPVPLTFGLRCIPGECLGTSGLYGGSVYWATVQPDGGWQTAIVDPGLSGLAYGGAHFGQGRWWSWASAGFSGHTLTRWNPNQTPDLSVTAPARIVAAANNPAETLFLLGDLPSVRLTALDPSGQLTPPLPIGSPAQTVGTGLVWDGAQWVVVTQGSTAFGFDIGIGRLQFLDADAGVRPEILTFGGQQRYTLEAQPTPGGTVFVSCDYLNAPVPPCTIRTRFLPRGGTTFAGQPITLGTSEYGPSGLAYVGDAGITCWMVDAPFGSGAGPWCVPLDGTGLPIGPGHKQYARATRDFELEAFAISDTLVAQSQAQVIGSVQHRVVTLPLSSPGLVPDAGRWPPPFGGTTVRVGPTPIGVVGFNSRSLTDFPSGNGGIVLPIQIQTLAVEGEVLRASGPVEWSPQTPYGLGSVELSYDGGWVIDRFDNLEGYGFGAAQVQSFGTPTGTLVVWSFAGQALAARFARGRVPTPIATWGPAPKRWAGAFAGDHWTLVALGGDGGTRAFDVSATEATLALADSGLPVPSGASDVALTEGGLLAYVLDGVLVTRWGNDGGWSGPRTHGLDASVVEVEAVPREGGAVVLVTTEAALGGTDIRALWVDHLPNGRASTQATRCASGFLADAVCCDAACGMADDDCLACSRAAGAAVDGECGPVRAGVLCRAAASACDAVDVCSGLDATCVDRHAPDGLLCAPESVCRAGACSPVVPLRLAVARTEGPAAASPRCASVGGPTWLLGLVLVLSRRRGRVVRNFSRRIHD